MAQDRLELLRKQAEEKDRQRNRLRLREADMKQDVVLPSHE